MTSSDIRVRFFLKIAQFISAAEELSIDVMPFAFYRTLAEELENFRKGTSEIDPRIKQTMHMKWLAMDFVIVRNGELVWNRDADYEKLGGLWKSLGGRWGGDWKSLNDIYHFEYKDGM
jgi:hypothetical protein